jgi:hypothetical protein
MPLIVGLSIPLSNPDQMPFYRVPEQLRKNIKSGVTPIVGRNSRQREGAGIDDDPGMDRERNARQQRHYLKIAGAHYARFLRRMQRLICNNLVTGQRRL